MSSMGGFFAFCNRGLRHPRATADFVTDPCDQAHCEWGRIVVHVARVFRLQHPRAGRRPLWPPVADRSQDCALLPRLYRGPRAQVGPLAAAIQGAETTMPALFRTIVIAALAAVLLTPGGAALAGLGQPSPWEIGLQQSATPVMDDIVWFHTLLLWVIGAITVFVLALLIIIMVKFNARANPTPSRTTHNTLLEV